MWQKFLNADSLVFIDESSAKTNMRKLYGRSVRGERCYGSAPGAWTITTMISSIRLNDLTEAFVFDGAIDRKIIQVYMRKVLFPTLRKGDIVILDNLSTHKDSELVDYFNSHGMSLLFLPTDSPNLNPIEKMWSKSKGILGGCASESTDTLFESIRLAFRRITRENARGWFKSCGYCQF